MSELFVCKSTFVFERDGVDVHVRRGATVRAGHPIMEGREDMFKPLVVDYEVASEPEVVPLTEIRLPVSARPKVASRGTR